MKAIGIFLLAILPFQGIAQIIQTGIKAGYTLFWTRHDERHSAYDDLYAIHPLSGYNVGATALIKIRHRFFLQSDIVFTTKGRVLSGKQDRLLKDRLTFRHIDVPLLYNMHFTGRVNMGTVKVFKWYVGAGPNFSYWLGGRGEIFNTEFVENNFPALKYKIVFGTRNGDGNAANVYVSKAKQLQVGFNIGSGIILEPINGQKIMIDARVELGHTWLGRERSADYLIPLDYDAAKNLKDRNNGIRLSAIYLWESNLDKKVRKRGKSTLQKRRL